MNMDCLHQLADVPVGVLLHALPATTPLREVQKDRAVQKDREVQKDGETEAQEMERDREDGEKKMKKRENERERD